MVQPALETPVDVVIVGAGPGGLMLAMTLARMNIKSLIIDAAGYCSHEYGRSDALQPRSMEIMESFGTPMEQLENVGKKIYGRAFWEISGESGKRTALARFFPRFLDFDKDYALAARQGLIEQIMMHDIEARCEGFRVQWNWEFITMDLPSSEGDPITVTIRQTKTGERKSVKAKFVVGADGAKSTVRHWASQFGVGLDGEALPVTWCVLDAVGLKSNHPDLERLSVLRSSKGIVLVIPREPINGKPSARFDIQLESSRHEATVEDATRTIKEIFHPYKIDWDEVNWWSSYDVSQRIINKYSIADKVFFVGDACHTHSPRAGLGLNTAILESHNLGWKIGLVLNGFASRKILLTYGLERHEVAKELVRMDRRLVEIYAGLEKQSVDDFSSDAATNWLFTLHKFQAANYAYQAGASITYQKSHLTVPGGEASDLMTIGKPGVAIGARVRPATVTRLSDSVPVPILSPFDGRFTIYLLVGDLTIPGMFQRLLDLNAYIEQSDDSIFQKFGADLGDKHISHRLHPMRRPSPRCPATPEETIPKGRELYTYSYDDIPQITADYVAGTHSIFRMSVVTTSKNISDVVLDKVMGALYPRIQSPDKRSRVFCPQHFFCDDIPIISPYRDTAPEEGCIFENPMHRKWCVSPRVGSIIVARPDGHVGLRTDGFGIESWAEVEAYFEAFLKPCADA